MECWKDIPGYEGIYQSSTLGNIRTCEGKTTYTERHGVRHWKQRVLKQKFVANAKGRTDARVNLWKNGNEKSWLVSRLVGMTWCSGYAEDMTINHINGNPLDNRAQNLEWVSLSENIRKGFEAGLYSDIQLPVALVSEDKTLPFSSMATASKYLGKNNGYISLCLKKGRKASDQNGQTYDIKLLRGTSSCCF